MRTLSQASELGCFQWLGGSDSHRVEIVPAFDGAFWVRVTPRFAGDYVTWRSPIPRLHVISELARANVNVASFRWICSVAPFKERSPFVSEAMSSTDKTARDSYVYFVKAKESGLIKIGTAFDVGARVKTLQTGSAEKLELLAVQRGDRELEATLHQKFAHLRKRGEWFAPGDELIAHITFDRSKSGGLQ